LVSPQIHQHPDGTISVRVGNQVYSDTVQNFKKDFGGNFPQLPLGIDERLYEQGVRHPLSSQNSVVDGGPMPWGVGDTVLGNLNDALDKKEQRLDKEVKRLKKQVDDDAEEERKKVKEDADKHNADAIETEEKLREARDKRHADDFAEKKRVGDQKTKKHNDEIEAIKATVEREREERLAAMPSLANTSSLNPDGLGTWREGFGEGFGTWREALEAKREADAMNKKSLPDDKSNQG
jgi:hypothetical protein